MQVEHYLNAARLVLASFVWFSQVEALTDQPQLVRVSDDPANSRLLEEGGQAVDGSKRACGPLVPDLQVDYADVFGNPYAPFVTACRNQTVGHVQHVPPELWEAKEMSFVKLNRKFNRGRYVWR